MFFKWIIVFLRKCPAVVNSKSYKNMHDFGMLSSHMQDFFPCLTFHGSNAGVDTDNLTEAFNNVLRSRYLGHRADTTVYSLVQVLVDVVFPKQTKEYTTAVTQATETYRVPRYPLPEYFIRNRPPKVQAAVLRQINLAKRYHKDDIIDEGEGSYTVADDKYNRVDIPRGKMIVA